MRLQSYLGIQRNLRQTQASLTRALQQLSTQKRINSASDDSVGLKLVTDLQAKVRSLKEINAKNIASGTAALDVADASALKVYEKLKELRELALTASDELTTDEERVNLNSEFQDGLSASDSLVEASTYNEKNLLDGSFDVKIQVGTEAGQTSKIQLNSLETADLGLTDLSLTNKANADKALYYIDEALKKVDKVFSQISSAQKQLDFRANANEIIAEKLTEAREVRELIDIPEATAEYERLKVLQDSQRWLLSDALETQKGIFSLLFSK